MKKIYLSFSFVLLVLFFSGMDTIAQTRFVDVPPGVGTLNDTITADTLANGERNDPDNTVYRLERGPEALYLLNGSVSNSGFPLTIVAAEGDGARPFLQPNVPDGGESARPFRPRGDITLKGLHVTGRDNGGGFTTRMLRCSADDITVTLDDCWFDKDGQSLIRCDNEGMTFKITNCVISNIGLPSSPDNGRGIDDRGNDIDTVIFENNTFYNISFAIIRDDGGLLTYARVNNNTFVNIGREGIEFGPTGTLEIKDNIFMNAGFMPKNINSDEIVMSIDSVTIDSVTKVAPEIIMLNNSVFLDTAKIAGYLNDTIILAPLLNPTMLALALESGSILTMHNDLNIEFNEGPPFNDTIILFDLSLDLDQADAPLWEEPAIASVGEGGNGVYHLDVPYDFGYSNSTANVGASDGMQLGDRNWVASPSTAVKSYRAGSSDLSIYPMPAQGQVTVSFSLEAEALVQMELYSLTGQRVADLMHNRYQAGSHQFSWNADMLETGMYILRMKAGNTSTTVKMIIQ